MVGFTYPLEIPHELSADTMSKMRSVSPSDVICSCRTITVARNTVMTERMITSMLFESSGSATSTGMVFFWYLKGTSTLLLTNVLRNHQMIPRYPSAIRESRIPPAVLPLAPPIKTSIVKKTTVTLG